MKAEKIDDIDFSNLKFDDGIDLKKNDTVFSNKEE